LIEAGAVLVVAFGAFQALMSLLVAIIGRSADEMRGREIWIRFATWILLALEFALAADLVREVAAGLAELREVAGEEPRAVEDPLALGLEDLLGGEVLAGEGVLAESGARLHDGGEV